MVYARNQGTSTMKREREIERERTLDRARKLNQSFSMPQARSFHVSACQRAIAQRHIRQMLHEPQPGSCPAVWTVLCPRVHKEPPELCPARKSFWKAVYYDLKVEHCPSLVFRLCPTSLLVKASKVFITSCSQRKLVCTPCSSRPGV